MEDNKIKQVSKYVLFLLIGILFGTVLSLVIKPGSIDKKEVIKTTGDAKFEALYETYDELKNKYYKDVSDETLINGAIKGMMESLDDEHSVFFDKESKKLFENELAGTYYGIGAELKEMNDEDSMIVRVFDDSPAEKAGVKPGDIFVSVDGESMKGVSATDIAKKIRSEKKDTVTIVFNRDGEEITLVIKKDNVDLLSVSSEMLDDNIGYVAVSIFGEKTHEQFSEAVSELEKDGMKSLIIDLRGNGGGYLTTVTYMISDFLDSSKVIFQMKTREGITKFTSVNNNKKDYKVIILVDEESASASEIMASAMQEQYKATLVGKTTFGKGTVQDMVDLSNGTLIKYTIQEWLTSNGNSINGVGIKPDVEMDYSEEFKNNPTKENDNMLNKAIELAK